MTNTPRINAFVNYCLDFYAPAPRGLYAMGATEKEVLHALARRLIARPDVPFDGDSFDREMVRDLIIEMRTQPN